MTAPGGEAFEWSGNGPAVLLLHGFTGTPWEVRPVAETLHGLGLACCAPLLPGHGTTVAALSTTTWSDWASAVDEHLTRLTARYGRVVLVGCSLGALLALDASARRANAGISGVVTMGAALSLGAVTDRALRIALRLGDRLPDRIVAKTGGSDIQDPSQRAASPAYLAYPVRAARYFATGQERVRAMLPAFRLPLLALHGLRDTTAPVTASVELVSLAASTDSTLIILPHSGHLVAVDQDRDEVARQIASFVRRIHPDGTIRPM